MPKDNENVPLPDFGPLTPSEPPGFSPDQMVRCEKCNRPNAPTRVSCIYCGASFAFNEATANQQRPSLRPLEKWEQGYSNILLPTASESIDGNVIAEVAGLLKLTPADLLKIIETNLPLPLARAASRDEAQLIERRLSEFGLATNIVADDDLGMEQFPPQRIRAAGFEEQSFVASPMGGMEGLHLRWADISLLVQGRLVVQSVEVKERKGRQELELLDASETFVDESALDVYSTDLRGNLRITANSFDFSCLQDRKALIAKENFNTFVSLIRERATNALFDDRYQSLRHLLEPAWPSDKQTGSRGWRRERPGKVTVGAVTETSNEIQFTRYSRLQSYLRNRH